MDWLEKSEMVTFLEEVQTHNLTIFNKAVIKECSIVVGFLQRPIDDQLLKHNFLTYDVVLNMTDEYFNFNKWIVLFTVGLVVFIRYIYIIIYIQVWCRSKILDSMKLSMDVIKELSQLDLKGNQTLKIYLTNLPNYKCNQFFKYFILYKQFNFP